MSVKELAMRWPAPFRQLAEEWDEVYLACFPEVVDDPAAPGSAKWKSYYSPLSRDFVAWPPMLVQRLMQWPGYPQHTRNFPRSLDIIGDLDAIVLRLDGRIGRAPSRDRAIWESRVALADSDKKVIDVEESPAPPQEEPAAAPADWKAAAPQPVRRTKRPMKPKQRSSPEAAKRRETAPSSEVAAAAVGSASMSAGSLIGLIASEGSRLGIAAPSPGPVQLGPATVAASTAYHFLHRVTAEAAGVLVRGLQTIATVEPVLPDPFVGPRPAPIEFKGPTEAVLSVAQPLAADYPGIHRLVLMQKEPGRILEAGRRLAALAGRSAPASDEETLQALSFILGHLIAEPSSIVSLLIEILTWDLPHVVPAEAATAAGAAPKASAKKSASKAKGTAPKSAEVAAEGAKDKGDGADQAVEKQPAMASAKGKSATAGADSSRPGSSPLGRAEEAPSVSKASAVVVRAGSGSTPAMSRTASLESLADFPLPPLSETSPATKERAEPTPGSATTEKIREGKVIGVVCY